MVLGLPKVTVLVNGLDNNARNMVDMFIKMTPKLVRCLDAG